jgi:hypothetical protein
MKYQIFIHLSTGQLSLDLTPVERGAVWRVAGAG